MVEREGKGGKSLQSETHVKKRDEVKLVGEGRT